MERRLRWKIPTTAVRTAAGKQCANATRFPEGATAPTAARDLSSELMPTTTARRNARRSARQGKKPTTQAGAYIREEMRQLKRGSGNVRSRKQAIAIGLSEARRDGVKLGTPRPGKTSAATRKKAKRDGEVGAGRRQPSATRSRGARKAARTRERKYRR